MSVANRIQGEWEKFAASVAGDGFEASDANRIVFFAGASAVLALVGETTTVEGVTELLDEAERFLVGHTEGDS